VTITVPSFARVSRNGVHPLHSSVMDVAAALLKKKKGTQIGAQ